MQDHSPLEGESQKPSRQAKADAVGGGRRAARVLKLYIDLLSIEYLQGSVAERASAKFSSTSLP